MRLHGHRAPADSRAPTRRSARPVEPDVLAARPLKSIKIAAQRRRIADDGLHARRARHVRAGARGPARHARVPDGRGRSGSSASARSREARHRQHGVRTRRRAAARPRLKRASAAHADHVRCLLRGAEHRRRGRGRRPLHRRRGPLVHAPRPHVGGAARSASNAALAVEHLNAVWTMRAPRRGPGRGRDRVDDGVRPPAHRRAPASIAAPSSSPSAAA